MKPKKIRIDLLLVERGLASSRKKAQSLILAGDVLVNDIPANKAGDLVFSDAEIRIKKPEHPYVSRGGLKLEAALKAFGVDPREKTALDVGASTGGFSDCLLQKGALKIFAVDVGKGQLNWKLQKDSRVQILDGVNARNLKFEQLGEKVDLIVMDVSFISQKLIFPALLSFATQETDWITLIKPQFEVGREKVGKGGIVRSEEHQQEAVETLRKAAENLGLVMKGLIDSPIKGTQGNREFLAHWKLKSD